MENTSALKTDRILRIYFKLTQGETFTKKELAQYFCVTERSIQRDLGALRYFLAEQDVGQEIIYDKASHGYRIQDTVQQTLSNSEILAVCKILLESRSMRKDEMLPILDKLISRCVPEQNKKAIQELIANEKYHYIEPHHNRQILSGLWEIGQAVQRHQVMEIQYERLKEPKLVTRWIQPVGIMFSEYYFYLTAFLEDKADFDNPDDLFPTIYRVDRIRSFKVLDEHFHVPYRDRFEEGEFRKRVQFMYGGKLEHIKFRYTGPSIEAVLDRLPTAEVTASFGVAAQAYQLQQGNIAQEDFIVNSEVLCLDVSVSAVASMLGQTLIPVPVLGAIIGNMAGMFMYQIAKDHLSEKEQVLIQNYRESFAALNKMLEERYQQLIAQLKKELTKYTSMLELAFDPNVNIAFDGSIALADYVGVAQDRVLRSKVDIDNYFLN